jgi:hypothetical protein
VSGCCKISASSDGVNFLVRLLVMRAYAFASMASALPQIGDVRRGTREHAPANANTLIKTRAADCIDERECYPCRVVPTICWPERLRDDLARLRWIIAFPASERSFKLLS